MNGRRFLVHAFISHYISSRNGNLSTISSPHAKQSSCLSSAFIMSGIFRLYFENVLPSSISSRRALLMAANSASRSIPSYRRPKRLAAMPVVLLPANGSSIHAPAFVDARIMRLSNPSGFCVGCFVQVFSHGAMAGSRHTSVICLSSLMCFIKS